MPPIIRNGFVMRDEIHGYTHANQVKFLEAAKNFPDLNGNWTPKQILGAGGYGIVLKFEYTGNDPAMPRFMVVKQSSELEQESIELESRHLQVSQLLGGYLHTGSGYTLFYK